MSWIISHWKWLTGGGLVVVAIVAFAVLNLPAFLRLASEIAALVMDALRKLVKWAKSNGWRAACFAAAITCLGFAWQWQDAETRVVTVTAERMHYVTLYRTEQAAHAKDVQEQVQKCETDKVSANKVAQAREDALNTERAAVEKKMRGDIDRIRAKHNEEMDRARRQGQAVTAGVLAGTIKLRGEWAGQVPATASANGQGGGGSSSQASGSAAGAAYAAELRAEAAGDIVRLAASCDADIRALQAIVKMDRQMGGPK